MPCKVGERDYILALARYSFYHALELLIILPIS
jgi:hypothetical protein